MPSLIQMLLTFILLFLVMFAKEIPHSLIPIEYKLAIITNLGDEDDIFNFKGSVSIHINCIYPTDNITLHSKNLKVDETKTVLRNLNQTEDIPTISETTQDAENDFLIFTLSQTLQTDFHYELELHFESDLEEEKVGFYRSTYQGKDGEEKWLAVTYFKPENARRAFPCFDGLTFKAKFTISLGRSDRFKSLSNMPLRKSEEMKPGWQWDHFETTPPMSTYVVGFTIIDFTHETIEDADNAFERKLKIWHAGEVYLYDDLLADTASFGHALQTNLTMKFPLPKLDMVVIPDYAVPVMESWGLIVWQERFLTKLTKVMVGVNPSLFIVTDQLVSQFLGNLVTIKSWSDLWFIEGFNMYISTVVVDIGMGLLQSLRSEITDNIMCVFNFDSLKNSQAVTILSNRSDSSGTIMETSVSKKISLLMRMLSHFVGRENLLGVIQQYMEMYQYKNAGSEELLEFICNNSHLPNVHVKTIMGTWITQAGFPLITVIRNYERGTLEVKQERFFRDNELLGSDATRWWVPLTYTTECEMDFNRTIARKWLAPNEDSITIKGPLSPTDWIIFNIDALGLYMVDYDDKNWKLIVDFLRTPYFQRIPPLTRFLLIDNAANLAWVGRLHYNIFLDLVKYVVQEMYDYPKYGAIRRVGDLNAVLKRTPVHERFMDYIRKILPVKSKKLPSFSDLYEDMVSWEPERSMPHQQSGISYFVTSMLFLEQTILCTGGEMREYSWNEYLKSKESGLRNILQFLACCNNVTLLQVYLEKSLHETSNGNEDIGPIIIVIVGNKHGFNLVTEFLTENIKTIHDRISPNIVELSPVLIEVARHIMTEDELAWFQNFLDTNRVYLQNIENVVNQALEIGRLNLKWHREHYETIERYFNKDLD